MSFDHTRQSTTGAQRLCVEHSQPGPDGAYARGGNARRHGKDFVRAMREAMVETQPEASKCHQDELELAERYRIRHHLTLRTCTSLIKPPKPPSAAPNLLPPRRFSGPPSRKSARH